MQEGGKTCYVQFLVTWSCVDKNRRFVEGTHLPNYVALQPRTLIMRTSNLRIHFFWDTTFRQCINGYRRLNATSNTNYPTDATSCTVFFLTSIHRLFYSGFMFQVGSKTALRSGDQIPVGARSSAPVHTGPGAHPDFCTMKRPGRGIDHTPPPIQRRG